MGLTRPSKAATAARLPKGGGPPRIPARHGPDERNLATERLMPFFGRSQRDRSARRPPQPSARPGVEALESRLAPYAASANAWLHPERITLGFVPDGTIVGANAQGYLTSNLFEKFDARFGSTSAWQNQVLKA